MEWCWTPLKKGMNALVCTLLACSCADDQGPSATEDLTDSRPAEVEAQQAGGPSNASPARDGDHAIRAEFEEAVARNTADAYRRFISRHPEHRLAERAQERLENAVELDGDHTASGR